MALPHLPVTFFFGATNQDTSAKGVKLGDLTEAVNVRQVKGGEFSKRDGFTVQAQTYGGDVVEPDSIVSPDGVQRIIRDRNTDEVYVTGAALGANVSKGGAARIFPDWATRFPATQNGHNIAPMAKRAGEYIVWLQDSATFGIGRVNSEASAESGSPNDRLTLVQSRAIAASALSDRTVRSFAVIDHEDFDPDHLWIFFAVHATAATAYPGAVYALKVDHDLTGSFDYVTSYGADVDVKHCLTSITAGLVDTNAGVKLFLAACGVQCTYSGYAGFDAFRVEGAEPNQGKTYSIHYYVNAVGQPLGGVVGGYLGPASKQTASGCCLLSVAGQFQSSPLALYYAFFGNGTAVGGRDNQLIILMEVNTTDIVNAGAVHGVEIVGVTPTIPPVPPEADFDIGMHGEGWRYLGQITGKEGSTAATGVEIGYTLNHYYRAINGVDGDNDFRCLNPDFQTTSMVRFNTTTHTFSTAWTARGSWLAHGWLNVWRDQNRAGSPYVITGYEDAEGAQRCYHLREWETGNIVAQFAYGEGASSGGCASRNTQVIGHWSDLNQAMLAGCNSYEDAVHFVALLGLQSPNVTGSVDVARIVLESWDESRNRPLRIQNPSPFRAYAISPGPIPTVVNGWQTLREAGPLLYPSTLSSYYGEGSS